MGFEHGRQAQGDYGVVDLGERLLSFSRVREVLVNASLAVQTLEIPCMMHLRLTASRSHIIIFAGDISGLLQHEPSTAIAWNTV